MSSTVNVHLIYISEIRKFVKDCKLFKSQIDAINGRYVVNAKSILCINDICHAPFQVTIHSNDQYEIAKFKEMMRRYEHEDAV